MKKIIILLSLLLSFYTYADGCPIDIPDSMKLVDLMKQCGAVDLRVTKDLSHGGVNFHFSDGDFQPDFTIHDLKEKMCLFSPVNEELNFLEKDTVFSLTKVLVFDVLMFGKEYKSYHLSIYENDLIKEVKCYMKNTDIQMSVGDVRSLSGKTIDFNEIPL